jgi:hypothetical protein
MGRATLFQLALWEFQRSVINCSAFAWILWAMESLAFTVSLIVFPAMFGGPLALILTFLPYVQRKRIAQFLVTYLAILSIIVGGYLLLLNVSRGGSLIGITGLVTGVLALMRIRRSRKGN